LELLSVATGAAPTTLAADYTQYGPLKADTAAAIIAMLEPVQKRFQELQADPGFTLDVLAKGATAAREIASRTVDRAKTNIGLLRPTTA
jgi:tryptophanyl-tRNA synthetase